jgi:hypothetical protein
MSKSRGAKQNNSYTISVQRKLARQLLASWDPEAGASQSDALLANWDQQPFAKLYKFEHPEHHWALLSSAIYENHLFDCFQIAAWDPDENNLSDVIAALFDRTWGHNYFTPILRAILETIAEKLEGRRELVAKIVKYINAGEIRVVAQRECRGEESRSDIDVFGAQFFLRIEHKLRGGTETIVRNKSQTDRLLNDAMSRADKLGIDRDNVIAILLSPEESHAKNRSFISLTFEEFASAVCEAVAASEGIKSSFPPAAASILGFATFYGRKL